MTIEDYTHEAVALLSQLIATPSVSGDEAKAADIMAECIAAYGLKPQREGNNVWVVAPGYDENRFTLLLNAHLDTVRAVDSWTKNPFEPTLDGDLLYGLGSNDCGGGLVSLLQVFRLLIQHPQSYNLVYLASAEEEVSGKDGIERVLPFLPRIDLGIVGEPTEMQPAVAEKGLMVLDITSRGVSGHAARNEGVNAIYAALPDLEWLRTYRFEKVSDFLGQIKMTVTMLNAGTQHNVVPDVCRMVVDVRTNELYTNREVFDTVCRNIRGEFFPTGCFAYRHKPSGYCSLCGNGDETVRFAHIIRPSVDAFYLI